MKNTWTKFHGFRCLLPGQHLEVPRVTSGGSRRRECLKPAKKQALRRPERCAAPVQPCLSLPEPPPPGGKGETPFPDLKYSAPAPCRSGSKGEAPWSPKAKSRFKKLVHGVKYRKSVFSFLTGHGFSDILCLLSLSLL